ncbi:MAG: sigma-70 family RNA polymerase sigma factor, partial [Pseudorhodobacter sp.]|nr:sigma-70 family RNA polymerase sigma factor [Pseudorhodobacter sp.]
TSEDIEELIQEGIEGVIKKIHKYDSSRSELYTYIGLVAAGSMYYSVLNNRLVKISTTPAQRDVRKFAFRNDSNEAINKIAEELKSNYFSASLVYLALTNDYESIDSLVPSEEEGIFDGLSPEDVFQDLYLPDESPQADTLRVVELQNRSEKIDEALNKLSAKERDVLKLRTGIGNYKQFTFEEIAERYQLSNNRIQQIVHEAIRKLNLPARKRIIEDFRGMV